MSKKVISKSMMFSLCVIAFLFLCVHTRRVSANASEYVKAVGDGINLGNTFETGMNERLFTSEKSVHTMIDQIDEQGFQSIRIPITWEGHFDETTGVVEESYYKELSTIVDYAVEKQIPVILTMYNDSFEWLNDTTDQTKVLTLYSRLWTQIATRYKDYGQLVSFEAANAPFYDNVDQAEQLDILNKHNTAFVKAVRATGGNNKTRTLFIPTLTSTLTEDIANSMVTFYQGLKDENVAVSVHYYGLWGFSINASGYTEFNEEVKADITLFTKLLKEKFTANHIPIVCTEYGLYGQLTENEQIAHSELIKYYEEFFYQMSLVQVPYMLWDTGTIFNRISGQWNDLEFAQIKNAAATRSSYPDTDTIYIAKDQVATDQTITITNHGVNASYIKEDYRYLTADKEYTIEGDTITIKSEYLENLRQKNLGKTGEYGTIVLYFSDGQQDTIHLIGNDTPTLSSSCTTTDTFVIPAQFNGNVVTTMEAYGTEDKKPVGPLDFTTYQEYNYSFTPDYENNTITLQKVFLDTLGEKEVTLRFHFKNGAKIEYKIIKSGTMIKEVNYSENESEQTVAPIVTDTPEPITTPIKASEVFQSEEEDKGLKMPYLYAIVFIDAAALLYCVMFYRKRKRNKKKYMEQKDED